MLTKLLEQITFYYTETGIPEYSAQRLALFTFFAVLAVLLVLLDRLLRKFTIEFFKAFTNKTKSTFDDFLILTNFPSYVAQIVPLALLRSALIELLASDFPETLSWLIKGLNIYVIILIVKILRSLLRTTRSYLDTKPEFRDKPIQSYVQVMTLFLWGSAIFFIVIELFDKNAWKFALQFGAASAIVLLIFKDTILGFVASIQVSVNDIVRMGDWITFSKFGADGYVTEINLATVRVQNFDNTFTTIPTYSLIADSFQNWRGMQESPGRRIKRSLFIKQNSVRFLNEDDVSRLSKIELIAPYLEHREKENRRFNREQQANRELLINGKNQTNLGVFRTYIDAFLNEHPQIDKNQFFMVRHLAPTSTGIPIEIFCFSKDKRWEHYEQIQADIFDHMIAAVSYFDLEIFESPSGSDLVKILNGKANDLSS